MKNWDSLTWDHLETWAGENSVRRGRSYQHQKRVRNLVMSEEGRLLGTVTGEHEYITSVWLSAVKATTKIIESLCTCPVGHSGCKHAVALVAEYLELRSQDKNVPLSSPEDSRWNTLTADSDEIEMLDEDDEESLSRPAGRRESKKEKDKIREHIHSKGKRELAELVCSLVERFPELYEEFHERIALAEGSVDRIVKEVRRELKRLTSEPAWTNSWTGEGNTPDYSRLIHRLERLSELGHQDAVAQVGQEIIERGIEHVGQSNDEGETGSAFSECLPVIFKAVAESSLPLADKLIFVIDANLNDAYDLIGDSDEVVMSEEFSPAVWSAVADKLATRLKTADHKGSHYQRDRLTTWITDALIHANRSDEALAIFESEARTTNSYERLVGFLIGIKRYDDAQRWAREGIEKTSEKYPGIASSLVESLNNIARLHHQCDIVAAHAAWRFFERPSRDTYKKLIEAAAKAGCETKVRQLALGFLESGVLPIPVVSGQKNNNENSTSDWPLPVPDYISTILTSGVRHRRLQPHYDVLIDMAIDENRSEDVLHWYDRMCSIQKPHGIWHGYSDYADRVAETVAHSHPQRSLDIYKQYINDAVTHASKSAYEIVVRYLRKMRPILKSLDRENEWTQLVSDLRLRHRNRPRFIEMLDGLDERPILQIQKARR